MDGVATYEDDFYGWAYRQAEALRRFAAERRDLPNDLDLENVAEEIEGVARSELSRAVSFSRLVMLHLIKVAAVPEARAVPHWMAEIDAFAQQLRLAYAPSMRAKLDLDQVWAVALRQAEAQLALGQHDLPFSPPLRCPFAVADLIEEPFDTEDLTRRLRTGATDRSD